MPITYNLAPIFKWQFTDNSGKALVGGKIHTYRSTHKQEEKPVYQDQAGVIPYPNPITLDGVGAVGPIYWANDENYYVEVRDFTDTQVIFTVDNYNATGDGGVGPVTTDVDYKNYIVNSQFRIQNFRSITEFEPDKNIQIAPPNWYFYIDSANTDNRLDFIEFDPGLSPVEGGIPRFYLRFECTNVGGGGESRKDIVYRFQDVKEFNNNPISIFFQSRSITNSTIELIARQYFGTGGGPSSTVETLLATYNLTPSLSRIGTAGLVIPTISAKTVGTNEDDYLEIIWRMPLNTICQIVLTSIQLNYGNLDIAYEYLTADANSIETRSLWELPIPAKNVLEDMHFCPSRKSDGTFGFLGSYVPVGSIIMWPTNNVPYGWLELGSGVRYCTGFYKRLYNVVGLTYGTDYFTENGHVTNVTGADVTFGMYNNGATSPITDVSTGFIFTTIQTGDATHNQITKITCNTAATLKSGDYFKIYSQNGIVANIIFIVDYFFPFNIDTIAANSNSFVLINRSDSAEIVAQKLGNSINPLYFYLPDYRGRFVRAWAHGRGTDPDRSSRSSEYAGPSGDNVGSIQGDLVGSHTHPNTKFTVIHNGPPASMASPGGDYKFYQDQNSDSSGGAETRPTNVYVMYIIKY